MDGLFIVLEGVDGAGTTTHTRGLSRALKARDVRCHVTQEPSNGPVGGLLRQTLTGRMVMGGQGGDRPPAWNTMALMFAADRLDHLDTEVVPHLGDGLSVLCDRYYHSSVAYQSITGDGAGDSIAWIRELNRYARRPDLTIVLDVPPEVAAERRAGRRAGEIFDDAALQASLCRFYIDLEQHFPGEVVRHVDAVGSVEEVGARILACVEPLLLR